MPPAIPVEHSYSPNFPLYPEADLIVQSSDGTLFATRAVYLRAASTVFDDLLGLPVDFGQARKDGNPLLQVDESAQALEVFLRYAQKDRLRDAAGALPQPSWDTIVLMIKMIDKYNAPALGRFIFSDQLPRFIAHLGVLPDVQAVEPVNVFAVAAIYELELLAQEALRWHHRWGRRVPEAQSFQHQNPSKPSEMDIGWRPSGIGNLPMDLLSRLSLEHIQRYCQLHDKSMSTPGYSWIKVGDDFRVSTPVVLLAPRLAQ